MSMESLIQQEQNLTNQYLNLLGQAFTVSQEMGKVQAAIKALKENDGTETIPERGPDNDDQPEG